MIAERKNTGFFYHPHARAILVAAGIFVFLYYFLAWVIIKDVYEYPVTAALFELLWLPAIAGLVAVPILAVIMLVKNNKATRAAISALVLIGAAAVVLLTH